MAHDDVASAHRSELYAATHGLADALIELGLPEPELDEILHHYAIAVTDIYRTGRRHAVCELITAGVGPLHPNESDAYVIAIRAADDDEREAALEAMQDITEPDRALAPRHRDFLN